MSGAVTIGLYFVQTATQNLILSCVFEALTSMGISTVYCILVDLFPTNLRFAFFLRYHRLTNNLFQVEVFSIFKSFFFFYFLSIRVMAAALSLTFGRSGALIGNLIFGFLIDLNCDIPIILFSAMLFRKC